ncbi:MAG: FtsW/RodA/SpoVE family cell cycle protein, partial [Ilumatobacter sp.]
MASTTSVQDRRRAALERVTGEAAEDRTRKRPPLPGLPTLSRRSTSSRTRGRAVTAAPEIAGPPPVIWYGIIAVVIVFVMLGLVMVLSASAVTEANKGNGAYGVFVKQSIWAGLGVGGLVIMARVPYTAWRRLTLPLAVVGTAAMLGPLVP